MATLGTLQETEKGARPRTAEAKGVELHSLGKKVAQRCFRPVSFVGSTQDLTTGWVLSYAVSMQETSMNHNFSKYLNMLTPSRVPAGKLHRVFFFIFGFWVNFWLIEASGIFSSDFSPILSVMTTGLELRVKNWMKLVLGHEYRQD